MFGGLVLEDIIDWKGGDEGGRGDGCIFHAPDAALAAAQAGLVEVFEDILRNSRGS